MAESSDIHISLCGQFGYQNVYVHMSKVLGTGSYGSVVKATLDHLPCAAKILHPIFFRSDDPGAVDFAARFEQECNILRELKHPCIVQFLGVVQDPNNHGPILLMELMEESLTMFLERSTVSLPFHIQLNITYDIVQALDYLHRSSILHRDLSSNNILLDADNKVKVTDFGMSKLVEANPRMTHTKFTQCPGTPAFMPPEALRAKPRYSHKLDIFSVGVLIIQIITRTFPAPTDAERVMEDPSAPLGEKIILVPELERRKNDIGKVPSDHSLLPIACHCLKDRDQERPTAEELCIKLKHLKTGKSSVAEIQHTKISPEQKLKKEKEKKSEIAYLHAQRRQLTRERITELTQQRQMSSPEDEKIDVEASTPEVSTTYMHVI